MKNILYTLAICFCATLSAQSIDVQFTASLEESDCTTNQYCTDLQVRSSSELLIGNSSIRFNYDPTAISFYGTDEAVNKGSYASKSFDAGFECSLAGFATFPYTQHSFDGRIAGDFLLTMILDSYNENYQCGMINTEWKTVSTICFEVLDRSKNPALTVVGTQNDAVADLSGTNFNAVSNNPSNKFTNGSFTDLGTTFDDVCEAKATGITEADYNYGWSIENISPVPVQNQLNINMQLPEAAQLLIQLYDLGGRLVLEQKQDQVAGPSTISLDLSDYSSGTYLLSVTNGTETIAGKLVKE